MRLLKVMFIEHGATKIRKLASFQECPVNYIEKRQILAVRSNFIIFSPHKQFICNILSSRWTGTIIFLTIDRIDYLDYLSMTIPSSIAFVLRSPPISYVSNIYYLPFTGTVWLCSISLVVLCTVLIAWTFKLHMMAGKETPNLEISDYFLFAIASSCQMGTDILTKVLSARISMVGL